MTSADTADMDEATRIVSELQAKLDELDHKVWQYRCDMAAEFNKYAEDILRNIPKDVSETVSKNLADDFSNYKSLAINASGGIDSRSTPIGSSEGNREGSENIAPFLSTETTTLVPSGSSEGESEVPRSPHEREREFLGIFTENYLPLLGETRRNENSSNHSPSPDIDKGKQKEEEGMSGDAGVGTRSSTSSPESRRPFTPRRRNTDEASVISGTSDHSDGVPRRSALRQVSNNSAAGPQSPRRVRFNIAGVEALPSSSPAHRDAVSGEQAPRHPSDSSDDEANSEQIENIGEDSPPSRKRLSSSQRLRALSRRPLDEDTNWTEVKAPADGSASIAGMSITAGDSDDEESEFGAGNRKQRSSSGTALQHIPAGTVSRQALESDTNDEVATFSDDEDPLGLDPLRRVDYHVRNPVKNLVSEGAKMLSPIDGPDIVDNKSLTSATRSPSKLALDLETTTQASREAQDSKSDDVGDLFLFDDEDGKTGDIPQSHHDESDSESASSPAKEITDKGCAILVPVTNSLSPPIVNPMQNSAKGPTRYVSGVVGSYRGKLFGMPVASEEVQAQAARLDMNSFVGSVNGNSGIDESDMQSFRESVRQGPGSFAGQPRSMSERMMVEDLIEAEKEEKVTNSRS